MGRAVVLLALAAIVLGGCARVTATLRSAFPSGTGAEPEAARPTAEDVTARIAELKRTLAEVDDPAREAELQLDMFSLQVDSRNEEPDYAAALEALERYASLDPAGAGRDEVQRWLRVLRELERVRDDARTARQDAHAARATLARKLQELRMLDLDVERQRRSIR